MGMFRFFRSKTPQLDLGDENDRNIPLESGGVPSDDGRKRSLGCGRRSSSLAERAPANCRLFFGFCDMRIATVLLNIMHIIFTFLLEVLDTFSWTEEELPVLAIIGFAFSGLGMFGALNFNLFAMIVSTLGLIALFGLYVAEFHVFGCAILCFILYAQAVLIVEMRKGIMTRESYAQQEYIVAEGREALQRAHSYASDVAETSKVVAFEVRQSSRTVFAPETVLGPEVPKTAEC
jgi:hypothetical protein